MKKLVERLIRLFTCHYDSWFNPLEVVRDNKICLGKKSKIRLKVKSLLVGSGFFDSTELKMRLQAARVTGVAHAKGTSNAQDIREMMPCASQVLT